MYSHIFKRCSKLMERINWRRLNSTLTLIKPGVQEKTNFCLVSHCQNTVRNVQQDSNAYRSDQTQSVKSPEEELLIYRQANPENEKKYKTLELEIDVLRQDGGKVPNDLQAKNWISLLQFDTARKRRKYLEFLWQREMHKLNAKIKKKEQQKIKLTENMEKALKDTGALKYGLQHNHMFLRIQDGAIKNYYNHRLITSMLFEPKLVFDCSYNFMNDQETMSCAKQLMISFSRNRFHDQQFNIYLCNADKSSKLIECLQLMIPTLFNPEYPMNITPKSYLDIFKKEDLIYLTPHCHNEMVEYNPEAVYIIGAYVDKVNPRPVSLAKAKKEGLKMEKLPLDRYLDWGAGSGKNLTVNQVLNILLDYRQTKSWQDALKNVPARKLREARERQLYGKIQSTIDTYNPQAPISNRHISKYYETESKVHIQQRNIGYKRPEFNFEARKEMQNLDKK